MCSGWNEGSPFTVAGCGHRSSVGCLMIKQHTQHFSDTDQKCSFFVSMIRVCASRCGEKTKSKSDHRVDGRLRVRLNAMHVSRQLGPFSGGGRRCCARCGINQVVATPGCRTSGSGAAPDSISCRQDAPFRNAFGKAPVVPHCHYARQLISETELFRFH